jgi:hypothetical protein
MHLLGNLRQSKDVSVFTVTHRGTYTIKKRGSILSGPYVLTRDIIINIFYVDIKTCMQVNEWAVWPFNQG